MGVGEQELEKALEEAAEDKVRAALWRRILGFKELFSATSLLEVKEPVRRRWKPYSRRVDPVSVAKSPDDPRRWMEPAVETVLTVEQEGDSGGFTKLLMLLDCSGSTSELYRGRTVLGYIKDAAYGLLAYAKQFSLPVATIAFSTDAWLLSKESKNYVEHGKRIFTLRPLDSTNLADAVRLALTLKPEKALVALLTDGLVEERDLELFAEQSKANRVIAAVVGEGVERVKRIGDRVQLYEVSRTRLEKRLSASFHEGLRKVKYKCPNCGEVDEKDVVWLIEDLANCTLAGQLSPLLRKNRGETTLSWENGFCLLRKRRKGILNAPSRQLRR
jgi:hypothetical protein